MTDSNFERLHPRKRNDPNKGQFDTKLLERGDHVILDVPTQHVDLSSGDYTERFKEAKVYQVGGGAGDTSTRRRDGGYRVGGRHGRDRQYLQ